MLQRRPNILPRKFDMALNKFIRLADSLVEFESDLNQKQIPITSLHALTLHKEEIKF